MGNFEYLENKIIATANSIATGNSTVASQLLTISDTLINKMAQLPQSSQISGFIITKKDNTTITVSKGSCYDSTMTTILNLDTSKDVTNNSQAVSKTYYVYVISNSTGSNIDIYIDTATVPSAPSGYTLYRTIGSYTTNANGVIDKISYFGIDSNSDKNNSYIIETYVNGTSWYRIYSDGWCEQGGWVSTSNVAISKGKVITFLKAFANTNYTITMLSSHTDTATSNEVQVHYGNTYYGAYQTSSKTAKSIRLCGKGTWHACGYLAEGEY